MTQRLFGMVALMAFVAGCDTTMLPPAEQPVLVPAWFVQGRFVCWNGGTRECYLAESEADADDSNRGWGAVFAFDYNPINGRTLTLDGEPVLETESADPPAGEHTYTLQTSWNVEETESLDPSVVEGEPESFLWVRPARAPQSPSHGETTVLAVTTTSGNPLFEGTGQASATTEVELTYVRDGRCRLELDVPRTVQPGEAFEIAYTATNCKRARLYASGLEAGTSVLPNGPWAQDPVQWTDTDEMEAVLTGVIQEIAHDQGGWYSVWLEADNALGRVTRSEVVTIEVPIPEEEPSGDPPAPGECDYERPFDAVITCDVPGSDPMVSCVTVGACDEDGALEEASAFGGSGCEVELAHCPIGQ